MYNKNTTQPTLAAQRAQQAAGYDPYDSMRVRALTLAQVSEMQRREADGILACYETELSVVRS